MHVKHPTTATFLDRFRADFDRMFYAAVTHTERERQDYARYTRSLGAHDTVMSFDQWKAAHAARGNREGQNHD